MLFDKYIWLYNYHHNPKFSHALWILFLLYNQPLFTLTWFFGLVVVVVVVDS